MIESITHRSDFAPAAYLAVRDSLPQAAVEPQADHEYRRQLLSQIASDLLRSVNRHVPRDGSQWEHAMKAVIVLASELDIPLIFPKASCRQALAAMEKHEGRPKKTSHDVTLSDLA